MVQERDFGLFIWDISEKDLYGNAIFGDTLIEDSKDCLIRGEEKLIAVLGLEDTVVIGAKDALLVAKKNNC